jgi:hypothetical protein
VHRWIVEQTFALLHWFRRGGSFTTGTANIGS